VGGGRRGLRGGEGSAAADAPTRAAAQNSRRVALICVCGVSPVSLLRALSSSKRKQPTYDKLISEVPKYKMITPSILCDRLRVSALLASLMGRSSKHGQQSVKQKQMKQAEAEVAAFSPRQAACKLTPPFNPFPPRPPTPPAQRQPGARRHPRAHRQGPHQARGRERAPEDLHARGGAVGGPGR
jgi:hypothetical protein